jgi:hypothetical protein
MRFAIYHREREYAREMGDPKLAEVSTPTQGEAERITAHMGATGTLAVPITTCPRPTRPQAGAEYSSTVPQPDQDREGEEIPIWVVYVGDEDAAPVGTVYTCHNFKSAETLAQRMARDRQLELIHEATTA